LASQLRASQSITRCTPPTRTATTSRLRCFLWRRIQMSDHSPMGKLLELHSGPSFGAFEKTYVAPCAWRIRAPV
jgi:hypothetical protein